MATWDTPMIKFEGSPTESLLSAPPDMYTSLFSPGTPGTPGTLDPSEILSPRATPEASHAATQAGMTTPGPTTTSAATPAASSPGASTPGADSTSEKKSTKKRKSWGQILPEPKTNLPPRKRAKTEDEKEQRRVERVLRNRRAAQSSRERKRLEVEALEKKNKELEAALNHAQQANARLMEELAKMQRDSGVMPRSSAPLDFSASNNSMTLLPELFGSPDGRRPSADSAISLVDDLLKITQSNATVNPASLSPALSPAPQADEIEIHEDADAIKTEPIDVSSDLTQLSSVGGASGDSANFADDHLGSVSAPSSADDHLVSNHLGLSETFDADRFVLESGLLSSPESIDYDDDYLAGDSSLFSVDPFDINDFLHDEVNAAALTTNAAAEKRPADPIMGHHAPYPETQVSSENSNLQPHSGASPYGCDDGGIAVGV
ncbi:hypothetical protein SODALDRAFT_351788 [Sodiomyces alkalinus F11]|uniref:BZIP domain-containing protein n=1 Tax=Sodiomyces alkalinus (strain CBS 110278 / VKM F-3762 / F11) TaxID=1314773 RepID=A0A3N2PSN8_SODAK|nr:hypothetical protein SODALDRAFT_351788 [Sodiomyces alkalinus F11]ROT37522.1 hypothetical protein SODALDRAFT_351788 [Sodiomyces alkalinus F11]